MALKAKTCVRYNEPWQAHALTFSCYRGDPFLEDDRAKQMFVDALAAGRRRHSFDIWAYVIMPEHVHLVAWPMPSTSGNEAEGSIATFGKLRPFTRNSIICMRTPFGAGCAIGLRIGDIVARASGLVWTMCR